MGLVHNYVLKNMSLVVKEIPNADGSVCNTINREEVAQHDFPYGFVPLEMILEFCQKHYKQLLPFMAERTHNEKLKDVKSWLSYSETTKQETLEGEESDGKDLLHKLCRTLEVSSHAWEQKGKSKEGRVLENSSEATSLVQVNVKEKMKWNAAVVNGKLRTKVEMTNLWKVKIVPGRGIGRDILKKYQEKWTATYLNLIIKKSLPLYSTDQ
ncbi:hypothetical protein Tco_0218763 [Tanacetum coccineum]